MNSTGENRNIRVNLLLKMTVEKDQRTNSGEVEQHSVKHATSVFSDNLRRMLLMNVLYVAIFALPFLFCVFVWPLLARNYVFTSGNYNFIGHIGIGYPGVVSTMAEGYEILFAHYMKLYVPILSLSIVPMVFGLSGLFHCLRGYMWGENVRPVKSFFRGIKKLWKPFLIVAIVFGLFMCGVLYGFVWHLGLMKTTGATAGSWVLVVFLALFLWLAVTVLEFLLPMFACYRFRLADALKNSSILAVVLWPTALFTAAFTIGVFMLLRLNTAFAFIIGLALLFIGFAFLGSIWMSSAQKAFGNFIKHLYESGSVGAARQTKARRGVNPYKEQKAKKKAQEGTIVGQAAMRMQEESGTPADGEKTSKKKKNQSKFVSYKRKK